MVNELYDSNSEFCQLYQYSDHYITLMVKFFMDAWSLINLKCGVNFRFQVYEISLLGYYTIIQVEMWRWTCQEEGCSNKVLDAEQVNKKSTTPFSEHRVEYCKLIWNFYQT
jgi:hypothetical protein